MGLFDKKYCDVCGEKIGLLGNRKLEDGNLCKSCAKKLSPLFSERRHSTVEEIKQQLAYREENAARLDSFSPDRIYGKSRRIYVDTASRQLAISYRTDWRSENPDLISFDQVKNVQTDIDEHKHELYYKDEEGKDRSYSPRRYEYEYSFYVHILVDSPWFDEVKVELTSNPLPDSPYSPEYRECELQQKELTELLMSRGTSAATAVQNDAPAAPSASTASGSWQCACGAQNDGKFCESCGAPRPASKSRFCGSCGWKASDPEKLPKFCPECGAKLS